MTDMVTICPIFDYFAAVVLFIYFQKLALLNKAVHRHAFGC